jgi:DNA-directed RNA polymerase subunit F
MVKPEILDEQPINMAQLKQEIETIKKRDKELSFRSNKTDEYLKQFVTLPSKKTQELKSKLEGLKITRLKPEFIVKIIDTMPATVDELKTLLQGYVVTINQADMQKIIKTVNEFASEKK